MDVNAQTFHDQLPPLIAAIADAHFVAFDLEFSGIPGHQINKPRSRGNKSWGKPSLQQRYEETKKAAETYQVLQLGITCVGENRDRGVYVVRPYNFFVNPVPDDRLNVERVFSYHSGAVNFLLGQNFRMGAPFHGGVQYFSRAEEATARLLAAQRQDRPSIVDTQPRPGDTESLELLRRLQEEVTAWKNLTAPAPDFLNFPPVSFNQNQDSERGLNSYQRRLVHQYIQAEHPDLVTTSRKGFIQIVAFDQERENDDKRYRKRRLEEDLVKQIGLRWLVEAICGGDMSAIDPNSFQTEHKASQERLAAEFNRSRDELRGCSTVLVGHNLFMDLIYFHACFFGPLPEKVEDFQQTIHTLFPRIIDTKYLATHDDTDSSTLARSSLQELDDKLSTLTQPTIELHPQHSKYASAKLPHEAGFDSYMTARVLIRLSAALERSGLYHDVNLLGDDDESYFTPPEGRSPDEGTGGVPLDYNDIPSHLPASKDNSSGARNQPSQSSPTARSAFFHATTFDLLGDIPLDEDLATLSVLPKQRERPASKKQEKRKKKKVDSEIGRRMPGWESPFWDLYGNKLRVNGTIEGVCNVGEWPF